MTPMPEPTTDPVGGGAWDAALATRHLADLKTSEVTRALRALSSAYVERRGALASGAALGTAGKRAAFALFYGPLHLLIVREIVRRLDAARDMPSTIVDLGCGTGVASAAWALEAATPPRLAGFDRHPWAVGEAAWTWRTLGLRGRATLADAVTARWGVHAPAIVAGYFVNELSDEARRRLLARLLEAASEGAHVLVVEPIARRIAPWWPEWARAFESIGGRADEWSLTLDLSERLRQLDKAVGLDHRQVKARSIYVRHARAGARTSPRTGGAARG